MAILAKVFKILYTSPNKSTDKEKVQIENSLVSQSDQWTKVAFLTRIGKSVSI